MHRSDKQCDDHANDDNEKYDNLNQTEIVPDLIKADLQRKSSK